jgi:hypothetical protein
MKKIPFQKYGNYFIIGVSETKKSKNLLRSSYFFIYTLIEYPTDYNFGRPSSETVSFFLPFARREAKTLRPLAVVILSRNPCLFLLFLCEG